MDDRIGVRLRSWRHRRGLTQRALAELAGFTQGYVAQIELGRASLDKHSSLQAIAQALQISVVELTGQRGDSQVVGLDPDSTAALRSALIAMAWRLPEQDTLPASLEAPLPIDAIAKLHTDGRFDRVVPAVANFISDVHARAGAGGPTHQAELSALVRATYCAVASCHQLGHRDLATLAAEQCQRFAERLGDPAHLGISSFALFRILTVQDIPTHSGPIMTRAVELLEPTAGTDTRVAQMYGMHHLMRSYDHALMRQRDDALYHLGEANALAERTGDRDFGAFWFGPTNFKIWRLVIMTVLGDGPCVVFEPVNPSAIDSKIRQATYYATVSRALMQTRTHDSAAVAAMLRAEAIAPQLVRLGGEDSHDTVRTLLRRRRPGSSNGLRALASRFEMTL